MSAKSDKNWRTRYILREIFNFPLLFDPELPYHLNPLINSYLAGKDISTLLENSNQMVILPSL